MKTTKKVIAFLLSVLMLFTMVSSTGVAVAAEEATEPSAAARVSISIDSYEAEVGGEINAIIKVENYGDAEGEIKLSVFTTPLAKAKGKTISLGEVLVNGKVTEEFSAVATDLSSITNETVRNILELVLGRLLPLVYRLLSIFMPNMDCELVKIGENYAAVVAIATVVEKEKEEEPEIDTVTDTDNDGISDDMESQYGADPNNKDTDNDGLDDYWELNWLNLKPDSDDSDGDGILDVDEDTDNDGIKNIDEINYNTDPSYYDTDFDNLSDYDEIFVHKTDPTKEDTDGDGVSDGMEILNNTDPLVADETFVSEVVNQEPTEYIPVVADAKVIGDSDTVNTLTITPITSADDIRLNRNIAGYLGYAYDFSVEGELYSAEITFNYDESLGKISEEFQPRIYYFNEVTGELVELPNQKVTDGQVSVSVNHFSVYILLNKAEFDAAWAEIKPPSEENSNIKGLDVVFVIDSSGSMTSSDKNGLRKTVAKKFVEKLGENDRAAVVDFDSSAKLYSAFTSDHATLNSAIDRVDSSGNTKLSNGMDLALKQFTDSSYTNTDVYKYIIMLTDGKGSYSSSYTQTAIDNGIVVYTVGLGSGVDKNLLETIATSTGGKYYFASTSTDLYDIYEKIEDETIDYSKDSNDDGITDYYTKLLYDGKLTIEGSKMIFGTDLNCDKDGNESSDFDGDGIKNGDEIKIIERGNKVTVQLISNPLINDSDFDGFDDYEERFVMKTSPFETTYVGGSSIDRIFNNSNYSYSEFAHSIEWGQSVYQFLFDWQKKKDAVFTMTDYFYDFASADSIDANKDAIASLAKKEKALEVFEGIVNIASISKNILDATTEVGSTNAKEVEKMTEDALKAKKSILKKLNDKTDNKKLDKAIEIGEPIIEIFVDLESTYKDIAESISESDFKEITGAIKSATGLVSTVVSTAKKINSKWVLPIKGLNKFANKYQAWMGSSPKWAGGVTKGSMVGIAFDVVDLGVECAEIGNTYGKLLANSQAFECYIDAIEYMSNHGNDKKFIKKASGEVMSIVLDKSNETYYEKVGNACKVETGITLMKITVSVVGDFCPYVKAADLIFEAAKIAFGLIGFSSAANAFSFNQTIDAISDACLHHTKQKIEVKGNYYSYLTEDAKAYLIQLIQSRIFGEKSMCDIKNEKALIQWLSRVSKGQNIKEIDKIFGAYVDNIYIISDALGLELSPELPAFVNNKWSKNKHRV